MEPDLQLRDPTPDLDDAAREPLELWHQMDEEDWYVPARYRGEPDDSGEQT